MSEERKRRKLTKKQMDEAMATVKIGSKAENLWQTMADRTKQHINALEDELTVNREILKLAESKVAEEQTKKNL